jgi:probable HAF family extracellular repeat protein
MVSLTTLGLPAGSFAGDINDAGQLVGGTPAGGFTTHAFRWTPGQGMLDLGTLGGANSNARAINELGDVVGTSETATGEEHAFFWSAATGMIDLGTLGGTRSQASDINDLGQVVGRADLANGVERPFLWTAGGGMTNLGTLGAADARSVAQGINDAGEVVGHFLDDEGEEHAFYWSAAAGMIELPTLSGIESDAFAINSAGRIAGSGDIQTGDSHVAIWDRDGNPPASPEERIQNLASTVTALATTGTLNPGQANGLVRPLRNALRSLEEGRTGAACSQLVEFQTEVARKVADGALPTAEANALLAESDAIRAAIGCGLNE